MNKIRKEIIAGNEISELKTYCLNGYEQKILIEGRKRDLPITIFLHGGPGSPIPFCAGCRGLFPEFTNRTIMVYWDQLGCGINDYNIDNSFSIDSYVNMAIDLIRELKKEFKNNPINLFAVSWGSIIAVETAERIPEEINKVVVYGQVSKNMIFNQEVFETLEKSKIPESKKKYLSDIKNTKEYSLAQLKTMTKLIQKYTEGYNCKSDGKAPIGNILKGIISSPDYSMKNFKAMVINGTTKNESLFKELIALNLEVALENVKVPYLILQGSTDIVTSTKQIKEFMSKTKNEYLQLEIIENSGHITGKNGMEKVIEMMFSHFGV